jgi:DNA-binding MurR/RpiR family transcriptional regulator
MMKPKFRNVLEMALEQGVQYGYNRAHKHLENPSESVIVDNIVESVMNSLYEWFDFEEENYD